MEKTYAGIPNEFATKEGAKIELITVPYDGTSTWVKGAEKGPEAFLDASENMELYDIETQTEVYREGVYLAPPVTENASPESMTAEVKRRTAEAIGRKKFVTLFGGEHSVSIGAIQAHAEAYGDLTVLQIDAHADLRHSYQGSECNHACAVYWASKNTNLLQVGIRSMDIEETAHMDLSKTWMAEKCHEEKDEKWMSEVVDRCTDNVYITIDLDAFDPSILPSTGTPEPGGLQWYQTLNLLRKVCAQKNVVGFDIVELCPNEVEKSSDFLAAKLYYKLLTYVFYSSNKH
ncbi:MAG: agmatinase [Flavobacteriales bacterium]|jgi:agmatinase